MWPTRLKGQRDGHMLPWIVRDIATGTIVGSTRYHDIAPAIDRVEIGYTWYAQSRQRTHVNTTCKLMLLRHAFETVGCKVVGLRTDNFNFRSQRAIEALGAKRDGVIRHFGARRDGTVRDVVMYSILAAEWPDVRRHLELRLHRHANVRKTWFGVCVDGRDQRTATCACRYNDRHTQLGPSRECASQVPVWRSFWFSSPVSHMRVCLLSLPCFPPARVWVIEERVTRRPS